MPLRRARARARIVRIVRSNGHRLAQVPFAYAAAERDNVRPVGGKA